MRPFFKPPGNLPITVAADGATHCFIPSCSGCALRAAKRQTKDTKMFKTILVAIPLCLTAASSAFAAPVQSMESGLGTILTGENGMTLYTFQKDGKDVSNCYDKCAANWPPLMAHKDDVAEGKYSIITRKDGSKQWAMDGKPLYFWVKDSKPGDTTGNGVLNVWDVARP
jgi:predicted lipoprotein with Yx(FWY)xxD motif